MTVKGNHPLAEIIARCMSGVEVVPPQQARRMVSRAAREAVNYVAAIEAERNRLREVLDYVLRGDMDSEDMAVIYQILEGVEVSDEAETC